MTPRTAIAGHRGGADLWPENSLLGFREAARLPLDFVEFDAHLSADGRLVVHHDPTLDRMTDALGAIMDMPWAAIERVAIRGANGERPPLLDEVIEIFKPTGIDLRLEIKLNARSGPYPDIEAKVAAALAAAGMLERTVISAFSLDTLARFRTAATPGRGLIWLVNPLTLRHVGGISGVVALVRHFEIAEIAPRAPDVTAELVRAAMDAGVRCGAYAVNDPDTIREMLGLGLSAFTSDRPDLALAARAALAMESGRA